jgi:hypothetical protein
MINPLPQYIRPLPGLIVLIALTLGVQTSPAQTITQPGGGLSVTVDKAGEYAIHRAQPDWTYAGHVSGDPSDIALSRGTDKLGAYQQISFAWREDTSPRTGWIRLYDDRPAVLCAATSPLAADTPPGAFPAFTRLPAGLHRFSYAQRTFSPPQFSANECSTPWLMFDDQYDSVVISPADHFMVAQMQGDGRQRVASGMNPGLTGLPAGFTQKTLLVFGAGINRTWEQWGRALVDMQGVQRPANDADTVLKYLGYWTDNGAFYYYNYDTNQGYAGTLLALAARYREEKIPIRYLQLDSWWYYKSLTDPDGRTGKPKSASLPQGEWNRYGGLLEYKAHAFLFPDGLAAFQTKLGLPLVTHNRWVDLNSPYRDHFKISGVAAIDPLWWREIAGYLQANGVVTYEQDWLDRIYKYSPAFSTNLEAGELFTGGMADACRDRGLTIQYCMPYPCYFLQGSAYPNLTTARVSDDRFGPNRWNDFLYTSRLASALGIWPWTDVFRSGETANLLLATLSAGPVGTGDALGTENAGNLFQSVRADGVIVKPDAPIVPLDRMYVADANTNRVPMLAATWTDHDGLRTAYLFAKNRFQTQAATVSLTAGELNLSGPVYVYDYFGGTVQRVGAGAAISTRLPAGATAYFVVAPVGRSGVAFLGDPGKFASNGRQRIASLHDHPGRLDVVVTLAAGEDQVTLHGASPRTPTATGADGRPLPLQYDPATGHFTLVAAAAPDAPVNRTGPDPIRTVSLAIKTSP